MYHPYFCVKAHITPKRPIASDSEYALFGVVIFKRVHDQFVQKCRENKYVHPTILTHPLTPHQVYRPRLYLLGSTNSQRRRRARDSRHNRERALGKAPSLPTRLFSLPPQTELLRLSRTNFSESFQILVHLKNLRLFVESVLRYGLPANYVGLAIRVRSVLFSITSKSLRFHLQ